MAKFNFDFVILTENEELSQIQDIRSQMKHIPTVSLINIPIIQRIMSSRMTLKNDFGNKHEDDRNTDFIVVKKPSAYINQKPQCVTCVIGFQYCEY